MQADRTERSLQWGFLKNFLLLSDEIKMALIMKSIVKKEGKFIYVACTFDILVNWKNSS